MRLFDRVGIRSWGWSRVRRRAWLGLAGAVCWYFGSLHQVTSAQEAPAEKKPPGAATTPSTATTPAPGATAPTAVAPWEYSPYRIRVWIAASAAPEFHPLVLADLQQDLSRRADSVVGASWNITVESPPAPLASTIAYAPETLTTTEISKIQKEVLQGDKLVWISLQADAREIRVRARELDCHTRTWSHTVVQSVRQPAALNQAVFDSILAVFSPLARIEDGQGKTCIVRVRAGGLSLAEDSPSWIGKGDVLLPVYRQNDRFGEPVNNRVQVLSFTFAQVIGPNELGASLLDCLVHSSVRSPIQGRTPTRRERWALKVRPTYPATELVIESRPFVKAEPKTRLAGLEIYAKTPPLEVTKTEPEPQTDEERIAAEKKNPPELIGVTDWRGMVTVPNQGQGLKLLYVKNGGLLLARLPMVAGYEERQIAEVPDDDPRLQAEGFVRGLNGEITDLVVQRQLIRVRVKKKIAEGKFDDAQKLVETLRDLKTMNDLHRTLDQQVTSKQKPSTSPGVKDRIDKLYSDERQLIAKHVDADIGDQLKAELDAARANPRKSAKDEDAEAAAAEDKAATSQ
jgi:hypothetical protein